MGRLTLEDENSIDAALDAAAKLVKSISFDDNGALIGGKWMGGHGGLLSEETRKAADLCRRALHKLGVET